MFISAELAVPLIIKGKQVVERKLPWILFSSSGYRGRNILFGNEFTSGVKSDIQRQNAEGYGRIFIQLDTVAT